MQRSDLVSIDEMQSAYKLDAEEAAFVQKLVDLPEKVIQQVHLDHEQVDVHLLAKQLIALNRNLKPDQVVAATQRLAQLTNQFGVQQHELDFWRQHLARLQKGASPEAAQIEAIQARITALEQGRAAFDVLLLQHLAQDTAPVLGLDPADPKVQQIGNIALMQASVRAYNQLITKDPGYAPMTRRGRFVVRVRNDDELGGTVKSVQGFKTKEEADAFVKKEGLAEGQYELIDRETLAGRAALYSSPDAMRRVRDKVREQTSTLIEEFKQQASKQHDPDWAASMIGMLSEFEAKFQPLEQEIKDVVSIKGDRFKERRYLVPGFNEAEFIPNILEYVQYKTVSTRKALTRARAELQLEQAPIYNDPELRERMRREMNYVLTNQAEVPTIRKLTFLHYLGFSVRHLVQNAVQIPMNGVSQMMLEGGGWSSYKHFGKATALSASYASKGTTGDRELDILLKQGEKEGLTLPKALDVSEIHTSEVQHALDSLQATNAGYKLLGERVGHQATKAWKAFERTLMSTSQAAETVNRRTTFIASVLKQRAQGAKDLRQMYRHATEFTDQVNFIGTKANRPGFIRALGDQGDGSGSRLAHGLAMIGTSLQSFTINHLSQLYAITKLAYKGDANAQRAALVAYGTLFVLGGALGMPFASSAEQVFEEITGVSLSTELRREIAEALSAFPENEGMRLAADKLLDGTLYGLPALAGVYASDSIGLGSPFIRYRAGSPMRAVELLGPSASAVDAYGQAFGLMARDGFNEQTVSEAARLASPAFLKNALRSFDMLSRGTALDRAGKPVTEPLSATGQLSSALGFTPMEVQKQRTLELAKDKVTKKLNDARSNNARRIAQLLESYQQSGNPDYLLEAQAMQTQYLEEVDTEDVQSFVKSVGTQLGEVRRPSTRRGSVREAREFASLETAFPSATNPYPNPLDAVLDELEAAQLLGQDAVVLALLQSLPQRVRQAALAAALDQAGLREDEQLLARSPRKSAFLVQN